jgi:hypothetical protein
MKVYDIALALFIFQFVLGCVNGLGIFDTQVTVGNLKISDAQVTAVSETIENSEGGILLNTLMLIKMFKIVFGAFLSVLFIVPMLLDWGIPLQIAMMIQMPIWLVEVWGIMQYVTGRTTKQME